MLKCRVADQGRVISMNRYTDDTMWPFARGGDSTIALVSILLAGVTAFHVRRPTLLTRVLTKAATGLTLLVLYFFRDPNRKPVEKPGLVVSAGDGEVVEIVREREDVYLEREAIRISVFLSIFDVHVQRVPISGKVISITHKPGKFLQAFRPEASSVNEHIAMLIESEYGPVLVKQIAGIMARRCVNYSRPGETVRGGRRYGMIKFGSRVDLYLPISAEVQVNIGDKVKGGTTPMARLASLQ